MEAQILHLSHKITKFVSFLILGTLVLVSLSAIPAKRVEALQTGPAACDTFTVDGVDYILGSPPPLAVWEPTNGTWIIANDAGEDVLHQTDAVAGAPADPINLFVGPGDLSDAVFAADVKFLSGSMNAGIVFRAQDHDNLYLFRLSASTAEIFKRESGVYTSLGSVPFAPLPNTWYTLRIDAIGSTFRAFIDNVFVLSATDTTFSSGKVGLRTHATEAYFDTACGGIGPFTWDVDDDFVECPFAEFSSIQDAINFAASGDTMHVCKGTYSELLTIAKQVRVAGEGPSSIVRYPPSGSRFPLDPLKTISIGGVDTQADPLVWVEGPETVTLEDLQFDGNDDLINPPTAVSVGVVYKDTRGLVHDTTFVNFENPSCLSCDTGFGIWAQGSGADLIIKSNQLTEIQKGHIVATKSSQARVLDNTLLGRGPTATTAQNGIEFSDGTSGLILSNTISNFNFTPPGTESAGIALLNAANDIVISGNTLSANELGMFVDPTNNGKLVQNTFSSSASLDIEIENSSGWLITQNTLTGSVGRGVLLENVSNSQFSLNTISGTTLEGILLRSSGGGASDNNSFNQNSMTGSKKDGILLEMDGTAGNSMSNNKFVSNTIQSGLWNGIQFSATGPNTFTNTSLKANAIKNNKRNGILLRKSTGATIEFNTVSGNTLQGILLAAQSNNSMVRANTVKGNKRHGIALTGNSDNNTFTFNTSKTNGNGITYFDVFWDQNPGATGNSATLNFFTTEKPAFFWN